MTRRRAARPSLYRDPPGTRVTQAEHDYEVVERPDRSFVRRRLSAAGRRRHDRLDRLGELGWEVVSLRGSGTLVHPDRPGEFYSVAAAAAAEGTDAAERSS